jgi:hypothetical protein
MEATQKAEVIRELTIDELTAVAGAAFTHVSRNGIPGDPVKLLIPQEPTRWLSSGFVHR